MKKSIIISFCFVFSLSAMEQQSYEFAISRAQEKHIPALTVLSNEVLDEFFKPTMTSTYSQYSSTHDMEALHRFFNDIAGFFEKFFIKATGSIKNNNDHILIASRNDNPDKILGLCAFTKEENSIFIQYLIVSQKLRGKRIGRTLLNNALSMYKDVAVCKLVTLAHGNDATHAFYEQLGFTSTKEICTIVDYLPNTHIMYQLDIRQ
jgi:ribosomal protein S18 acetylase RimI-like enzyme